MFKSRFFKRSLVVFLVALAACRTAPPPKPVETGPAKPAVPAEKPVESSCKPGPDVVLPPPVKGVRSCVIDVGSRNVKLLVGESTGDDPRGLHPVRTCRARLQLGEKTQDATSRAPKDLAEAHQRELADLIARYQKQCEADGGQVVGAFATEWARKVTNLEAIEKTAKDTSGVSMKAIPQEREGVLGYLAATKGQRGRVVLDFGSRSFQVSVWPAKADAPSIMGLPLGIDEVGERFFDSESVLDYAAAEKAFVAELRKALAAQPEWKSNMKRGAGRLNRTLVSLGENGDVALAIGGKLWTSGKTTTVVDEATYQTLVAGSTARVQPLFGRIMGSYDMAALRTWRKRMQKDKVLFNALRSPERRKVFGHKMLAFPALVNFIATELVVDRVVLVPDELAMGLLVETQAPAPATKPAKGAKRAKLVKPSVVPAKTP